MSALDTKQIKDACDSLTQARAALAKVKSEAANIGTGYYQTTTALSVNGRAIEITVSGGGNVSYAAVCAEGRQELLAALRKWYVGEVGRYQDWVNREEAKVRALVVPAKADRMRVAA